jgi:hypothetical protein
MNQHLPFFFLVPGKSRLEPILFKIVLGELSEY